MQNRSRKQDTCQPELKDIIDSINRYIAVNRGMAEVIFSCVAFDQKKINARAKDAVKHGTDRLIVHGYAKSLKHHLSAIKSCINECTDKNGNVST